MRQSLRKLSLAMATQSNPTILRRQLAAELRRLREHAQLTVADVASRLGWSESKLSRIETASTGIRRQDLERLLGEYGVAAAERTRLLALSNQSRQRAWWEAYGDTLPDAYETYIGFEAEASSILTYEALVVPGLLQTDEYAKAVALADGVVRDSDVISSRVQVRMARQAVLTRDPPPQLWAIIDEAVLRRPIGGPDVMRRQLLWLVESGKRPNVTVQVLPFSIGAHQALAGSYVLLEFADGSDSFVYSEGMTGGVIRGKPVDVRYYLMSFGALKSAALPTAESLEFIEAITRG